MRVQEKIFSLRLKLSVLFFFCVITVFSQLQKNFTVLNTDSIINVLPGLSDREKIQAYFNLSEAYYISNPDSALLFAEKAWKSSQKVGNKNIIGFASLYLGKAYYFKGDFNQAISYCLPAYDYSKETKNIRLLIMLDEVLTFAYFYSGNTEITKKHLAEIELHLKYLVADTGHLGYFTIGFGYFYRHLKLYEKSIQFLLQYEQLHLANSTSPKPLALCYGHLGYCYEQIGEYDKALYYYRADIELSSPLNRNTRSYFYLGNLYLKMDSLQAAIRYYKEAIEFYEDFGNVHFTAMSALELGKVYMNLEWYDQAQTKYKQALVAAQWVQENKMLFTSMEKEISTLFTAMQIVGKYKENEALKLISEIHFQLYQLYLKQSETKKALEEYILFHETFEQQNLTERITSIEEIKDKFESEKKDQKITLLSQQNELNALRETQTNYLLFGLTCLIILIVVVFILFIRQNKLKAEQRTLLLQQRLLRSQMNPHFIFNALSNISNLIDKKDNETASLFLNRFSRMVRHLLESTRNEFIELDQEIDNIENYHALQKLRFADRFDYKIEVDDKIDPEGIEIPPMLIQPFVENAIEHGFKTKETKGHIDIRFKMVGEQLFCEVDDDGIGRTVAGELKTVGHKSMATKIVNERLETLSRKLKQKLNLEIIDLKTEANVSLGTRVIIGLPYRML